MENIFVTFHIEGAQTPVVLDVSKASHFIKELELAGKKWRLGKTC